MKLDDALATVRLVEGPLELSDTYAFVYVRFDHYYGCRNYVCFRVDGQWTNVYRAQETDFRPLDLEKTGSWSPREHLVDDLLRSHKWRVMTARQLVAFDNRYDSAQKLRRAWNATD